MQNTDYRHLLEGYNSSINFVLASENDHIIFANKAALDLIGINVQGEPLYNIIGEDIFTMTSEHRVGSYGQSGSVSMADYEFFGKNCVLNIFGGSPTLYIFTPHHDAKNEEEAEFSPSSLLGFSTEVRKQIAPLLFAGSTNSPSVTKCGYQMIRLISNFSDYIRLGSRSPMLFFMNTDIVSLCSEIVSSAEAILDIVGIPIMFHSQLSSCILSADCQLIRRAIMNLICNSAKYSRPGNEINVSLRFSNDQCFLRVSDCGSGINQSEIPNIYEKFKSHKFPRMSGGYGLGLALVRRVALLHGGNAALTSRENIGTDITISLPINKVYTRKAEEIVVGTSFDSALLELSEVLTADEFKKAYNTIYRKNQTKS